MEWDWYEAGGKYVERTWAHDGRLDALPHEWQRELAALHRVWSQVNNGGYLQFFVNCGRESYEYASRALKRLGARRMAEIVDHCQALIDEHVPPECASSDDLMRLLPNRLIGRDGRTIKEAGSVLPESVLARLSELSYEFMDFPDGDLGGPGLDHYRRLVEGEAKGGA